MSWKLSPVMRMPLGVRTMTASLWSEGIKGGEDPRRVWNEGSVWCLNRGNKGNELCWFHTGTFVQY